jgi:hypothetical protein
MPLELRCKSKDSGHHLTVELKDLFLDGKSMTKDDLLAYLRKPCSKREIGRLAQLTADNLFDIEQVVQLTFDKDATVAFRAAWLLEYCILLYPSCEGTALPSFLEAYHRQFNQSCRRHFTKIMMFYTEASPGWLSQYDPEPFVETTFEWLIDPETPVAVRVNCMDILFNLKETTDWLQDELRAQIGYLLKDGSAALQSRGKRVLKRLG